MESYKIKSSFLSRLFRIHDYLLIENGNIKIIKNNTLKEQINYTQITDLPIFISNILSSKILFKTSAGETKINWIQKKSLHKNHKGVSDELIKNLNENLINQIRLFRTLMIDEFPRDSSINKIDNKLFQMCENYHQRRNVWDDYFDNEVTHLIRKISKYPPLKENITELRESFEQSELQKYKNLFDTSEANPLTLEQRLAVIRNNDRNMILAAAGTGKTSVMVAKTIYLVKAKAVNPQSILLLAYNKAAANELKERYINRATKNDISTKATPAIMTFHALGLGVLKDSQKDFSLSNFTQDAHLVKKWLYQWILDFISKGKKWLTMFLDLMYEPINPFNFKSNADYQKHIRDNEYRTLMGEKVKGYQELVIANTLFMNGIEYEYESSYVTKKRIDVGYDYKPDFYIKDTNIYVEHFGIDRNGQTRPDIDSVKYNNDIDLKRDLHKENETILLETYHYNWVEGNLEKTLIKQLIDYGVEINPRSKDDVFTHLNKEKVIHKEGEKYLNCLSAIRVENLSDKDILKRLKDKQIIFASKLHMFLVSLHNAYKKELARQRAIDFDDMILKATDVIKKNGLSQRWEHVLIDEFQDISNSRLGLVQNIIRKLNNPILSVVGDDWQAIYRFSGGKLELTTHFEDIVGTSSNTTLQKTFRYNNSIANTAGKFVMRNPEQFKKQVVTNTKVNNSQVFLIDSLVNEKSDLEGKTVKILKKIRKNSPDSSVSIIARYNYLLSNAKESIRNNCLENNVNYWTFHSSKGLEADYCILIGFFQGKSGFPNKNLNDIAVEALLPSLDSFPHTEERRLMYVGITRARHKSYIIADPFAPSEFITELLSPSYELHIASDKFKKKFKDIYKCEDCSEGFLKLHKGQFGEFYSCTTGIICNRKTRVCKKCGSPSVDGMKYSKCKNKACNEAIKLCKKCGRPMKLRDGKFGSFWGCSGYGVREDQCKYTEKWS